MNIPTETKQKIIRDFSISLLLYALPVLLMFLSFYVTGKKPWLAKSKTPSAAISNPKK